MKKAIFLDRDGTIIKLVYYEDAETIDTVSRPDQVELTPDIGEVLRYLKGLGYLLIVISNQPRIGIKKLTPEMFEKIRQKFNEELEKGGVKLDKEYYCFHHPFASIEKYAIKCECRKPGIKFFNDAEKEFNVDLSKSWTIGDSVNDILAGDKAGTKTILIANLLESAYLSILEEKLQGVKPDFIVKKPKEIISIIKE
ncbi:MAG: hypothetical protein A2Y57_01545 [Candidatus Woykebacteria bacterium RBG_13_40_7b]|uniref:D,D-heptose 1,7-bisphosphate phosphatase n=1 Tax=Candidatus Woykebacteria bacterium RBG_13_40_7b TaxID=1802594 RepID=A0A1G1W7B7_9BACT|nr:MAG: hypothetical protein A2Y57_01545 [Candidatus Woykebacteria bacterium RBG_13_40_7b]